MSIRTIITLGNPLLRKVSSQVPVNDPELRVLTEDMIETMNAANGLGLAAPQIGVLKRVVIIDMAYIEYDARIEAGEKNIPRPEVRPVVMLNPELRIDENERYTMEEGCLSIPGYRADVTRPAKVIVTYTTLDGNNKTKTLTNLGASAVQHEVDHLNGVLFVDHISRLKRNIAKRKVARYLSNLENTGSEHERRLYGKS